MANFRIELYVNALRRQAFFDMMISNDCRADALGGAAQARTT